MVLPGQRESAEDDDEGLDDEPRKKNNEVQQPMRYRMRAERAEEEREERRRRRKNSFFARFTRFFFFLVLGPLFLLFGFVADMVFFAWNLFCTPEHKCVDRDIRNEIYRQAERLLIEMQQKMGEEHLQFHSFAELEKALEKYSETVSSAGIRERIRSVSSEIGASGPRASHDYIEFYNKDPQEDDARGINISEPSS